MSQGELALFVGPSGSGKTTLLNLIAALDVPIVVKLSSTDLKSPACPAPLPQLLYLGLNEDEAERMVFDGVLVHIAGGKRGGDFNMRFGQPSASLPSDPFPFNEMGATDPISGRSDGLLERLAVRHRVPKIFFTNTSCEYWRGDASLIHTDATGTRDIEPIASSRFYHFAGTQHSAGTLPLTDTNPQNGERGQQALNSVSSSLRDERPRCPVHRPGGFQSPLSLSITI
jgi:energy-coupling factor transporter ATP-binding protein EcfA2